MKNNEATFSQHGLLIVRKAGGTVGQFCPYTNGQKHCGLWCPGCMIDEDEDKPMVETCMASYDLAQENKEVDNG